MNINGNNLEQDYWCTMIDAAQNKFEAEKTAYVLSIVSSLNLSVKKDGDMFCVLWGENIQEGLCGFGKTPYAAVVDFNKNYYGFSN